MLVSTSSLFILFSIVNDLADATFARGPLGPAYPAPRDLSGKSSVVVSAWKNLSTQLDTYIRANSTLENGLTDLGQYTISIGAFSVLDPAVAGSLQFQHTSAEIRNSSTGSNHATGDSVFRIGSVTKAFTVYTTLTELGHEYWMRPITDFLPVLSKFDKNGVKNPLTQIDWSKVTLGTIAGQISGLPRDAYPYNTDAAFVAQQAAISPETYGFPPLSNETLQHSSPCNLAVIRTGSCPPTTYLRNLGKRAPVFLPWATPMYSNANYEVLALALQNITGREYSTILHNNIIKPLQMSSTVVAPPSNLSQAIIPDSSRSLSSPADGTEGGGQLWSTTNDLAKFGTSILNSTLLNVGDTRQWLKPITHTANIYQSVGRPWEILRVPSTIPGRVTDLYTKDGDVPDYSAYLILSPDHAAGFSILIAGSLSQVALANTVMADLITKSMLPALELQAAHEAEQHFAGQYEAVTLNTSITLQVNPRVGGGLIVSSFISNSTDVLGLLNQQFEYTSMSMFSTGIVDDSGSGKQHKLGFRAAFGTAGDASNLGPFTAQGQLNPTWGNFDSIEYGGVADDLFVFTVGEDGMAKTIEPMAWRIKMQRN